jgi:signal transduction histidine kinase/signal recognition particle receptor subunit beta
MAQWNRKDRVLYAKVVYYGPAFGGKTTNLVSLHRITDPKNTNKLLTVQTSDDRTLFFDLLPFDLGDILGYQVAMKLYTVPGQVRYETTRQVVLTGADAIIFVADSTTGREEQNRWSLQNVKMNMHAKRLDPARVPLIYQFNKQDLPDAAPPEQVARWLGVPAENGFPAVATRGDGVLETFIATSQAMLESLVANADERTRQAMDLAQLGHHVQKAFAPFCARVAQDRTSADAVDVAPAGRADPIVLQGQDQLEGSIETSLELAERLSTETARALRREREAETYLRLNESLRQVGASFDRKTIVDSALTMIAEILEVRAISLLWLQPSGEPAQGPVWGMPADPLLAFDEGRELLQRMMAGDETCVVADLQAEWGPEAAMHHLPGLQAAVSVPIGSNPRCAMLAYAPQPDGKFEAQDVRFLEIVAGHLTVGLEKARLYADLTQHRDRLEEIVAARTEQLRKAHAEQRALEQTKDRFISNVSHEMRTPLTAILSSAMFLRDYKSKAKERAEMVDSIVHSGQALQKLLDDLFRLAQFDVGTSAPEYAETETNKLIDEAVRLHARTAPQVDTKGAPSAIRVDLSRMARAVANLLDNAAKFSPPNKQIELRIRAAKFECEGQEIPGMTISVLDRGPGVPREDRERIFAPLEQAGDQLTAKPEGMGIGLHEVRAIARQHGGLVEYRSRRGGGSEFRIAIPLAEPVPERTKEAASA